MKQALEEGAKECRRTTAQSMGVYAQYHSIDECPNHGITYDEIAEAAFIKGAEWQSKQSPWISVKERLPNNDNNVLVCNNRSHFVGIANYYKKPSTWGIAYSGSEIRGVTHWCPIPSFDEILKNNNQE